VSGYVVKRGDTIGGLARRFGLTARELAEANELTLKSRLHPGQELAIPAASVRPLRTPDSVVALADDSSSDASRTDRTTYVVRRGDTLYGIARRFGLSVESLKRLNRLSVNRILPGDRLTVSQPAQIDAQ
jgi:LysM repeat protein